MRVNIDVTATPTAEQMEMLKKAEMLPVPEGAEYGAFSDEELLEFRQVSEENRTARQKQTVTLRLSPQALKKARSLGKGYTSVLSRILEDALDNAETIRRHL